MKKWIFSLALLTLTQLPNAAIQKMEDHKYLHAPKKFHPGEALFIAPELVYSGHLTVKGMEIRGFDSQGEAKIQAAFELLEQAVNSDEFKDRIINFKNAQGERAFASNKGLSNEEIYAIFMDGRETLQMDTPGEMNFYLKQYYRPWSRVIGYTSGNTNVISVNKKFFRNYVPSQVASNLAHEWTHKIGFDHTSAKEHDSAPYAIGYIVGDIAKKLIKLSPQN